MGVEIISAGAGTGKTTELTRLLADAVENGTARADRIVATTFSRKAAAELQEGARRALLARGRWEDAQALSGARVGTVNSVCDQLIRQFAFELGLSPDLRVIPEEQGRALLETALAEVLEEEPFATQARETAFRLGVPDWPRDVARIIEAARQNGIPPERLGVSAARSMQGMLELLDAADERDAARIDADLAGATARALEYLQPFRGTQKNTDSAINELERAARDLREGRIRWADRMALGRIEPGAKHLPRIQELVTEARRTSAHPSLRLDLERFVGAVFHFAARGLVAYRDYKRKRRFLDFVDQEELALALLDDEACAGRIAERLDLVLVDEFQDTSPLQMAIFTRLHRLARRSVWVGDAKQSIYGFRGADPVLLQACVASLEGLRRELSESYRSRPGLVRFVSGEALSPRRDDAVDFAGHTAPEPVAVWLLQATNKAGDKAAIAGGIAGLLQDPEMRVLDPVSRVARRPRAGDVAVLCALNEDVREMADALAAAGLRAAVAQPGLLATWEGRTAEAALRVLLEPGDRLARATFTYHARGEASAEEWLASLLRGERDHEGLQALAAARPRAASASPLEALDLALDAADVAGRCLRWPDAARRLANLEALRGLASAYEKSCRLRSLPATGTGLLQYLRAAAAGKRDGQAMTVDAGAIQVLTCHAAKGLEWPIVIVADLDRKGHPEPFELEAAGRFDPQDPLRDRWIRLWISPFGTRTAGIDYVERARDGEVGRAWAARDREQDTRLLYVAMTRARDQLVLAARETARGPAIGWLTRTGVRLPTEGIRVSGTRVEDTPEENSWFSRVENVEDRVEARVAARRFELSPEDRERLVALGAIEFPDAGGRLQRAKEPEALGSALHAFLAVESGSVEVAERIIAGFGQVGVVTPEEFVAAADRLKQFLDERYPGAVWHREVPLAFRAGTQEIHGIADLLLECADGWVVVDHKSFTGPPSTWRTQGEAHMPQIEAYARALAEATARSVIARWLHFPLAGGMLQVVKD